MAVGQPEVGRDNSRKRTHCKHGHELTPENTYAKRDGRRECKTCRRAAKQRYKAGAAYVAYRARERERRMTDAYRERKREQDLRRRRARGAKPRPTTHCKHGHEYTEENTYWVTHSNGHRYRACRTCQGAASVRWARARGVSPHGPECGCARCLWQRVEAEPSPEVRNMMRNHRRRAIERELRNARERLDQRLSEQPTSPLGEAVGRAINQIGERAWRDTASRMK